MPAPKIADRVKETSTTTGTGAYALAGAAPGFRAFSDALGDGDQVWYVAAQQAGGWEIGLGTYAAAGPSLARTLVLKSSNADAAVNWAAGTRDIFCETPSATLQPVRHNFGAGTDPTATDDEGDGYGPGSIWVTASTIWVCRYATSGDALWGDLGGLLAANASGVQSAAYAALVGHRETWDTTTNATPMILPFYINALPDQATGLRAMVLTATVLAVDQANQDTKAFRATFLAKENPSVPGAYVLIGSPTMTVVAADTGASAWTCTIGGASGEIDFTCTGAAAKTINWYLRVRVDSHLGGDENLAAGPLMPGFDPIGGAPVGALGGAALYAIDLDDGSGISGVCRSTIPAGIAGGAVVAPSTATEILPALVASLLAGEAIEGVTLDNLVARLSARASLEASFHLAADAAAGGRVMDSVLATWQLLLEDGIAGIGEALGTVTKVAALADALAATGQATGNRIALVNVVQAITLEGLIRQGFTPDLTDEATLASATAANARMLAAAVDALLASDAGVPMVRISAIAADAVEIASPAEALLRAKADLADGVMVYVTLRLGDTDYVGWVLNTDALAASQYRTAPYDSYASFKGKDYGAGPNGIDEFGGTTDDGQPIDWSLRTFLTDFGTGKFKRVPDVYIGAKATGQLVVKVITIDPGTGVKTEDWYGVERAPADAPGNGRAKVGRGLKSTWWAVELVPIKAGAALEGLDSISMRPLILDRRV